MRSNTSSVIEVKPLHEFTASYQNTGLRVLFLTALILLFVNFGNSIVIKQSFEGMIKSADLILLGKIKAVASLIPVQNEKIRERVHKYLLKINDYDCNLKLIQGLEFHIKNNTWPLHSPLLRDIKDRRVIPVLIEALDHDNDYWRKAAASTLGRLKSREAVEGLMALFSDLQFHVLTGIGDIKPSVRIEAVKALGEIGDRKAVPFLGAALLNTPDYSLGTKEEIALALGKIGDRRAVPCLGEALLNAPDRAYLFKDNLLTALTEIGDEDALIYIGEALLKSNLYITEKTVKALVEIGDEKALPYLEEALIRATPSRRPFVEEAIEEIKKRRRIDGQGSSCGLK